MHAARMLEANTRTRIDPKGVHKRAFVISGGKAISTMRYLKPHFDKFERLANLCLTIFQHRPYIPRNQFRNTIQTLFGKYVTSKQANKILLDMTNQQYNELLTQAKQLAPR